MATNEQTRRAHEWIDSNERTLSDFHQEIWSYHEPAWREYRSADAYRRLLRDHGFDVEAESGGMPTAFVAEYGDGSPVLSVFAEYDAVPENSQQAVPYEAPREGLHPTAAGHTDPHSALGVAALGGALGAKAAIDEFDLEGTIRLFGEPAEKVCGSKPVHAAKGYYDDHAASIVYHPWYTNTVEWDTYFGSYWSVVFEFEADRPEEWWDPTVAPEVRGPRCPGATDAVCLMYTNTKYTKEAMFPNTAGWTLNEFLMSGGQKTSDNLTPQHSLIQYSWRSPTLDIQERIYDVLRANAEAAAATASCSVTEHWVSKTRVGLPNNAMADLAYRNLEQVGPPELGEDARAFGREIQENLGLDPAENPFEDEAEQLLPPEQYEERLRRNLPDWQRNVGSDDYVEYTWHAPTVRLLTGRPRLQPPDPDYRYPRWAYNALGGVSSVIDPGMFVASKAIAGTLVDLLVNPEELERATEEFVDRTGGGIGGSEWVGPLLSDDFEPPIDLPWPEYVETERGREWSIPTAGSRRERADRSTDR